MEEWCFTHFVPYKFGLAGKMSFLFEYSLIGKKLCEYEFVINILPIHTSLLQVNQYMNYMYITRHCKRCLMFVLIYKLMKYYPQMML